MTAIGSIGSNCQQGNYLVSSAGSSGSATATSPVDAQALANQQQTAAAGGSTQALGDLRSQIETAVTNAVNGLDPSSSPSDIAAAVKTAVTQTLRDNGIDPQQLGGAHAHRHHHHHAQVSPDDPQPAATDTSDADGSGSDTDTQPNDPANVLLTLLQNLQSNDPLVGSNVGGTSDPISGSSANDAPQAKSILLLAALDNSSGAASQVLSGADAQGSLSGTAQSPGGINLTPLFAQLFANFPNGTGVDVQA